MKSLRILTTVHFANPGACLFSEAIEKNLTCSLPDYDVRILDYVPRNWYYYELARVLKIHGKIPTYNIQRHLESEKFYRQHTHLDRASGFYPVGYDGMVRFLIDQGYDALVVGMVIWDLVDKFQIPKFPSIYWLSEKIPAVKIAYAASGASFSARIHLPKSARDRAHSEQLCADRCPRSAHSRNRAAKRRRQVRPCDESPRSNLPLRYPANRCG